MDPNAQAAAAYGNAKGATKSQKQVEFQAFAKITKALSKASGGPDDATPPERRFPELVEALHENLRLWTIIMASVAEDENKLSDQLRAGLFYLAEFTREHTRKVLRREAGPEPLVEINTAVMRGLARQQERETCPA